MATLSCLPVLSLVDNTLLQNASSPSFNFSFSFGSDYVHIGAVTELNLDVTTVPGAIYFPMDLEIILPYENDSAVFSVCSAEITYAGENLPCFDREQSNASMQYLSK